jgi:thiamine-phosphate pyrophosphorylase
MVRKFRKSVSGLILLKKLVYLISPSKINKQFYISLDSVLSYGNVKFFQLRIKKFSKSKILKIAKKIRKITFKYRVKFIINDDFILASKTKADGCHMGQLDGSVKAAKNILKNKIIGITCHNSKSLAKKAIKDKVSYLAFGSFFKSKLKPNANRSSLSILKWSKKNIKKPIVAIGGINNLNYKRLIKSGAKYIAISSFIWDNPKLKPELAIRKFK